MMKELAETISRLNAQIELVDDFLSENGLLDRYDLKLHEISWYCCDDFKKDFPNLSENDIINYFSEFCEMEFSHLREYVKETTGEDWGDIVKYVHESSAFRYNVPVPEEIENFIFHEYFYSVYKNYDNCLMYYNIFSEDGKKIEIVKVQNILHQYFSFPPEENREILKTIVEDLQYVEKNLLNDIKKEVEDILEVKNYIDNFKREQVERFIDFVKNNY